MKVLLNHFIIRINCLTLQEKRNIHCYFDEDSGMWVKMPVSWEQHTSFVKPLVAQIQVCTINFFSHFVCFITLR